MFPSTQIFFILNSVKNRKSFLASFNLAILSRSRSFSGKRSSVTVEIVDKKRMCLWPLLRPERGQGSNWGLLLGLVTQLLITLEPQLSWQLTSQSSTGRHKKWFVSNHTGIQGVTKKQVRKTYTAFMSCHVKCGDKTWNKKLAKVILIVSVTRACGGEKGRAREGEV